MMWDEHGEGWGMHGGGGGWLALLLLFAVMVPLVAAVVLLWARDRGGQTARRDAYDPEFEAERVLRRRFAAGEIDEDELSSRQAALSRAARH